MFTLNEIIDLAVRIEENGEKAYRKAGQEATDPDLAATLTWLADEEAEHRKWFPKLREGLKGTKEDPRLEEMTKGILQGVLGDQTFSIAEADFSQMKNLRQLLTLALEFEKDTILFYEMLGVFLDDETVRNGLEQIIEEEKRHVRALEEWLTLRGL